MVLDAVDWGDVPTWIGALTTMGALIAAGLVVRVELRRDARTEAVAEQIREREARSDQADLVGAWNDLRDTDGWAIIHNGSQLPIYQVRLQLYPKAGVSDDPPDYWASFDAVPPGDQQVWNVQGLDGPVEGPPEAEEKPFFIDLEFRDTAGRKWHRSADGALVRRD